MSNALAQTATALAISTPQEVSFDYLVEKNAKRTAKGMTRDRMLINNSKLFSACAAEYKSLRGLEHNARLDNETAEKLQKTIDDFITAQINRVTVRNAINARSFFHHDMRNRRYTLRQQVTGEDIVTLKEQHLASTIHITTLNKRLDDLMKKPNPDYDRENAVKEQIREAEFTQQFINARIADLEKKAQ